MEKYGMGDGKNPDLRRHREEFDDWTLDVLVGNESIEVLCCPEDRRCERPNCIEGRTMCRTCQVLVCRFCLRCVRDKEPKLPAGALANDMMIVYAPREIYAEQMTVMEMICASPCITSMICFSLEVKYGNMFNTNVHMNRHRVGGRGNATTFPMPWQAILTELMRLEEGSERQAAPDLPKVGEDLKYVVQVLLKTNDEEKRDNLKNFVHQARVRRHVVVNWIVQSVS